MKRIFTLIIALTALTLGANADNRTVITLVEATSTDYASICVVGASVKTNPTAKITKGAPAFFDMLLSGWYKKTGENTSVNVKDGLFTEGTWFYRCQLRIEGDAASTYRLSENTVVKINGKTCKIYDLHVYDTFSRCYVDWPEMTITGKLDDRTEISLIEATSSDYLTIPKVGTSVTTKPTVSITTGTQARFDIASGDWTKKSPDGFMIITSGGFNEGTWCYYCDIRIDGTAGKSYRLSDNLVVKLNGLACEAIGSVIIDKDYSSVCIRLPEINVTKQGNRTVIPVVEGTTNQDWRTIPKAGEWLMTKPTINVTAGEPAYFLIDEANGGWQKKVNDEWGQALDDTFTPGTWRFCCQIRIDEDTDPDDQYVLEEDVKVKVNGEEWETIASSYTNFPEYNVSYIYAYSPEITIDEVREGKLGTQGTWRFKGGVLTVNYNGQMPQNSTSKTTDPEVAYRLKWIDFLSEIKEVIITGANVEVQPYFLFYSGDGDLGQHPDDHIKKLTLGSGVKKIGKQAFATYDLKDVYCYGIDPPELSSDTGGSNVFWKSRIQANMAFLHLVKGASTGYAMINSEWAFFNHSAHALDPADDPDYGTRGDLNGDTKVDIADAVTVLNIMASGEYKAEADINGDDKVDIADFVTILNIMAAQ